MSQFFEVIMLICFGISWPISIVKALRTKIVAGKSPIFMSVVAIGYVSGILFKLTSDQISPVIALYIINFIMVCIDLFLYRRYLPNNR
jgi:lipopolysaccharide export LptBFGC system permease protein LptF